MLVKMLGIYLELGSRPVTIWLWLIHFNNINLFIAFVSSFAFPISESADAAIWLRNQLFATSLLSKRYFWPLRSNVAQSFIPMREDTFIELRGISFLKFPFRLSNLWLLISTVHSDNLRGCRWFFPDNALFCYERICRQRQFSLHSCIIPVERMINTHLIYLL